MTNKKLLSLISAIAAITFSTASMAATNHPIGADKVTVGRPTAADRTIIFNKGAGAANPAIKWNNSSSKIQFSNDGTTFKNIGAGSGGSGGINLLSDNPDAESGSANWSASGGAFTTTTTAANVANGAASFVFTPSAGAQTLTTTAYAPTGGMTDRSCLAAIFYKTTEGTNKYILNALDASDNILGTATLDSTNGVYAYGYAPFLCPTATTTSVKLQVKAAASTPAAAIYFDEAFLGSDYRIASISQTTKVGSGYIARTLNCSPSRANTALGAFTADADCPGPTVADNIGPGIIQTTDADAIKFTVNSLPPGVYTVHFQVEATTGVSADSTLAVSDGTTTSGAIGFNTLTAAQVVHVTGHFVYTTTANRTFELYGSSGSGTLSILNSTSGNGQSQFWIERSPSAAESSTRVDQLGWRVDANIAGANPSLGTAAVSSYTGIENASLTLTNNAGLGVISAQIPCSSTNSPTGTTCAAGSESVGISFNAPSAGDVEVCASFAHYFEGSGTGQNAAATFQLVETASNAQTILQEGKTRLPSQIANEGSNTVGQMNPMRLCGNFSFASSGQKTIRLMYEQTVGGSILGSYVTADASAAAGNRDIHWDVRPINYLSGAMPIFKGMVSSQSAGRERVERARIDIGASITSQSGSWLTGVTRPSTGQYNVTIASGIFSAVPTCVCTVEANAGYTCDLGSVPTTTSAEFRIRTGTNSDVNHSFTVICMGPN